MSPARPRPPPEGEGEEAAGDEQREVEVASQSAKKTEEGEEAGPDMPVVQIKPEPEEMECMTNTEVRRGRRAETEGVAVGGGSLHIGGRSFFGGQTVTVNLPPHPPQTQGDRLLW